MFLLYERHNRVFGNGGGTPRTSQTCGRSFKRIQFEVEIKEIFFLTKTIKFLGHEISLNSIRQLSKKVEAIAEVEPPKTTKQLRSFLGMAGHYRRFIKDFGTIAAPLFAATSSDSKFVQWTEVMHEAFEALKFV